MKEFLKLIRVKHWLKNILIFLPIFFSVNVSNKELLKVSSIAFIVFCLSASIVYIINDLNDLEKDKNHPIKKLRSLASGKISITTAIITIVILTLISLTLSFYLYTINNNILVILIPIIYIVVNILYSIILKDIPIIDVSVIVLGFVLRVMYGGVVTNIEVSKYLYLMIIFGAFFLGFGKRRNEIIKNGTKSRKSLDFYNQSFLDKNMYVMLGLAVMSYTLWCVDKDTINRIGNDYLFWTIPLVIIILQLYSLNIEGNSHGDPIDVILSDKKLILTSAIYAIIMTILLYLV